MSSPVQISLRLRRSFEMQTWDGFVESINISATDLLENVAHSICSRMSTYPAVMPRLVNGYPWASERQRMFVLIAIAKGLIEVPRPRSGAWGSSWSVEKYKRGYRIRSSYPAAKYVVGTATNPDRQAQIHRGRWQTLRDVSEEAVSRLPDELRDNVLLAARRSGLR